MRKATNKYGCMMCEFKQPHRWHDNGEYNYDQEDTHMSGPIQGDEPTSDYPTPKEMAEEAIDLVYSDRQKDYGHPADDYGRTAALWSALLGVKITAKQAALCMVLVKLSREMNMPKPDNMIDAHGYLLVAGRIKEREMGRE